MNEFTVPWFLMWTVVAVANVAVAVANYWNAKRHRTMRSIERELRDLRCDVDALKILARGEVA